jgi:gluconate 2-dehydrogenase gamma chain
MKRRESFKLIVTGTLGAGVIAGCKTNDKPSADAAAEFSLDRNPDEIKNEKRLLAMDKYFSDHEMATITILADIIIPKDDVSGSASDAKVPEFIEFIVKDMPQHQLPLKGGLRWLDLYSIKKFEKPFNKITEAQRISIIDEIAYPKKAKPEVSQGVKFFTLMRDLTITGFYTSEIGVKDLGYQGNKPNQWKGVPDEVLKQYNLAYTEKELKECI